MGIAREDADASPTRSSRIRLALLPTDVSAVCVCRQLLVEQ